MFQRFTSTRLISTDAECQGMRPGQWVTLTSGARGQYLGTTRAGVTVIRWQSGRFASTSSGGTTPQDDARNNRPLRQYAKRYGAK
jgi:hypothetical protein